MNVVITGASKGIGKAIAAGFAADGATLFLCARNELDLYNAVAELQQKNATSTIHARVADISTKDGAKNFGQWILDKAIPIDVLVNNAGQFIPGSIYNEPDGLLEQMIETNLYSAYHVTRTLLPSMINLRQAIFLTSALLRLYIRTIMVEVIVLASLH